jgi:hypothetical protein
MTMPHRSDDSFPSELSESEELRRSVRRARAAWVTAYQVWVYEAPDDGSWVPEDFALTAQGRTLRNAADRAAQAVVEFLARSPQE